MLGALPQNVYDFVAMFLRSNRVRALALAFATATFKKYLPDFMPDQETLAWFYSALIAFIIGDTIRPIDPDKPPAFNSELNIEAMQGPKGDKGNKGTKGDDG